MSYSMSYTWYDVTCNVGICKSKSTLRDTSYLIRRMTGRALSYCSMRVAGCALYHKVVLHCDVTPRYAVTSVRVTLSCDFSPERHPAIRHIHVKTIERSPFFVRLCCRGDLVGRTAFWVLFEWLVKVRVWFAVACFLPGRAKDLSAPLYRVGARSWDPKGRKMDFQISWKPRNFSYSV